MFTNASNQAIKKKKKVFFCFFFSLFLKLSCTFHSSCFAWSPFKFCYATFSYRLLFVPVRCRIGRKSPGSYSRQNLVTALQRICLVIDEFSEGFDRTLRCPNDASVDPEISTEQRWRSPIKVYSLDCSALHWSANAGAGTGFLEKKRITGLSG